MSSRLAITVRCFDGSAEVHCVNPLFAAIVNIAPTIGVEEIKGVDVIYTKITNKSTPMKSEECNAMLQQLGIPQMLRLKFICTQLGISKVTTAVEAALNATFNSISTPGDARLLFGVANNFQHTQNDLLLAAFAGAFEPDLDPPIDSLPPYVQTYLSQKKQTKI